MSVNYQTLKQELDRMEKSANFQYARLISPDMVNDAIHDTLTDVIYELRQWMEEA